MSLMHKSKLIIIFIFCCSIFTPALAGEFTSFTGRVNSDRINVRCDATVSSAVVCVLSKRQLVEVVAQAYDWYKIRLPKEAAAYVKKELVECINCDPVTNPGKCLSAKVIKERINIRLAPDEASCILGKIDKSSVVHILSEHKGWYKITAVYQSFGWVNKKFIDQDSSVLPPVKEGPVKPAEEIKSIDQLTLEGKISPYGVVLWRTATHKLITPKEKVYFLKGNRKSLDSLNNRKVKVSGKLIEPAEGKYPMMEVHNIEVLN